MPLMGFKFTVPNMTLRNERLCSLTVKALSVTRELSCFLCVT